MVAIFEVETIESKWVPPFDKNTSADIYYVKKGELFDVDNHIKEDVFMLDEIAGDVAIIKYDERFIVKKGIHSANLDIVGPQTLKLHMGKPIELSFMWGDSGVTKKITYQGFNKDKSKQDDSEKPEQTQTQDSKESSDENQTQESDAVESNTENKEFDPKEFV